MQHLEELQQQEEYETRELVFSVKDNTINDCAHHLARYQLRLFRGTRETFDNFYLEHIGSSPVKDYVLYDSTEQIERVEHGHCDNNIIYVNNNKDKKQRKEEYRYLKSGY